MEPKEYERMRSTKQPYRQQTSCDLYITSVLDTVGQRRAPAELSPGTHLRNMCVSGGGERRKENFFPPSGVQLRTTQAAAGRYTVFAILAHLTLILPRSRTGTVWFYTATSNKRAARPKLYTKSLTRDLKRMYSRLNW